MKRVVHRVWLLCMCLALCSSLLCCARQSRPSALEAVLAMSAAQPACPAGEIYLLPHSYSLQTIDRTESTSLGLRLADDALLQALLGKASSTSARDPAVWECSPDLVDDGALRLATAQSPCELIVLHCVSRSHTSRVADLLLHRLELLRREYRATDFEHILAHAQVMILGKFVILVVCAAPEHCLSVARRTLS